MPSIAIFSALKVGHQGSSAMQGSWATFSAEKCQFTPCIAIFFSTENINFFH
jgi:hypothetical protein